MRTAIITCSQPDEFRKIYLGDFPNGGLFIETDTDYFLGERVRALVCFPDIPDGVAICGNIVWRRSPSKRESQLKPGIGVSLDAAEKERLQFLLNYSEGRARLLRGKSRRIPTDFQADFSHSRKWYSGKVLNISCEGLFVLTGSPAPANALVQMRLHLISGSPPEICSGKIVWQCERKSETGIGVEFQMQTQSQRQKILEHIERNENLLARRFPPDPRVKSRPGAKR